MHCQRSRIAIAVLVAALAASTGACDSSSSSSNLSPSTLGPHDAAAEIRSDLMVIEPADVQPGDNISVVFPDGRGRGVHYVLESGAGDQWNLEYHLVSDWGGDRSPTSTRAESLIFDVPDIGFSGAGSDLVSLPAELSPGGYRICTGNSSPNICALLTVRS